MYVVFLYLSSAYGVVRDTRRILKYKLTVKHMELGINQHNAEEKSSQIPNILTIFSKAKEVIAWLGLAGPHTSYATHTMSQSCDKANLQEPEELAIQEMLRRPWFRRIWVKQEVFAARDLKLQCGNLQMPWSRLVAGRPELESVFLRHKPMVKSQLARGECRNQLLLSDSPFEIDIVNVLRRTSNGEASDPKDFVYGVLGMSSVALTPLAVGDGSLTLPVDYRKGVVEIFEDMTRYVIERDRCLSTLLLTARFGQTVTGTQLPSWTLDWRHPTSRCPWLEYVER